MRLKIKLPLIANLLERRGRKRLRCIIRGYRLLKDSNKLSLITELKEELTNTHLNGISARSSTLIFGAGLKDAELIVRQYLLFRVANLNLNKSLLYSLGEPGSAVIHPLPPEWRIIIKQHGFRIPKVRSVFIWYGFVGMMLAFGIASVVIKTLKNIKAVLIPSYQSLGHYVYFESLTAGNLPQPCKDGRSYNIITWYQQWPGRVSELDTLCHSVKGIDPLTVKGKDVISIPSVILSLTKLGKIISFVGWGIKASLLAIVDVLRCRWWHALLLQQSTNGALVRLQDPEKLAKDYLFHNANWIYQPLWSYEAAKQGSRITFYFYSTNIESFKHPQGYPIQANSWQIMNWPYYLVWDEYQADFVRRAVGNGANIEVVGSIWFLEKNQKVPLLKCPSIAVFDISPKRDALYFTFCIDFDYYTINNSLLFLEQSLDTIVSCNYTMLWKRKRIFGALHHPKYIKLSEIMDSNEECITIDPEVSSIRVILASIAVISMPYTSTALTARELGKPSVFYDPTGLLQKDDRAAHGIPIINSVNELKNWLTQLTSVH